MTRLSYSGTVSSKAATVRETRALVGPSSYRSPTLILATDVCFRAFPRSAVTALNAIKGDALCPPDGHHLLTNPSGTCWCSVARTTVMEGSSEDRWSSHRRRRLADLNADEPDEGEFVPGHHYHPGEDTEKYYENNRDCSSDSDETISDDCVPANYGDASPYSCAATNDDDGATSSSHAPAAAAAAAVLPCPFCWKEFRSHKAVCGHMKVHREQQGIKKDREVKRSVAAVGSRWGATGNRGCSGSRGRAASSTNAGSGQPMALVVAAESEIVLQPKPLAFAAPNPLSVPMAFAMANDSFESSSTKSMHEDAMETVDSRAANPPMEASVHLHAAPPPPPAAPVHQQLVAPPPGDRQSPKGYTCKKCGMWFRTHQGLGGHMVGHKNRERELARALAAVQDDGAVPHRSNAAKPEKVHVCKVCGAEFPGGVQLGGHMRKHWAGPPINKKPRFVVQPLPPPPPRTTTVGVADLTLALPVEDKADEALPAPRPPLAGRVRLFGIDIGPAGVQTPAAQQGSSSARVIGVHQ